MATSPKTAGSDELFGTLAELQSIFPDWRFGQLIANLATVARGPQVESIWDSEDEGLLTAARWLIVEKRSHRSPLSAGWRLAYGNCCAAFCYASCLCLQASF